MKIKEMENLKIEQRLPPRYWRDYIVFDEKSSLSKENELRGWSRFVIRK